MVGFFEVPYVKYAAVNKLGQATSRAETGTSRKD
jgi:hypothetical protein